MDIIISNQDPRPIYMQVGEAIRSAIISGELKEGDALPSIRGLAKDLRISVITTKRAFEELERDGFIATVPGKGTFVSAPNTGILRERRLRELEDHLRQALMLGRSCGLTAEDVAGMVKVINEEASV